MKEKPVSYIRTLEEVEIEIGKAKSALPKLKKSFLWRIPVGVMVCLLIPFIPGKNGRPSMSKSWGYEYGLLFVGVFFALAMVYAYFDTKDKSKKRLRELKLRKHILEKQSK